MANKYPKNIQYPQTPETHKLELLEIPSKPSEKEWLSPI